MNCDEARAAFTDLYDETLAGPRLVRVREHVDGCPACHAEWLAFQAALQGLKELADEAPPAGFAARVVRRIETPSRWERVAAALVFPLRVKLPIHAAALVMLGLAGLWMGQRSPEVQRAVDIRAPRQQEQPASTPTARPAAPPAALGKAETAPRAAAPRSDTRGAGRPAPPAVRSAPEKGAEPARTLERDDSGEAPAQREDAPKTLAAPPAAVENRVRPGPAARVLPPSAPPQEGDRQKKGAATAAPSAGAAMQSAPAPLARRPADDLYSNGVAEYAAHRYEDAIRALRAFLAERPGDARAPDARFLLADAYRAQGRYAEASAAFDAFLGEHPDHRRAPAARYRQGEIRLILGDRSGCGILHDALQRYPDAPEAASARETLAGRCP